MTVHAFLFLLFLIVTDAAALRLPFTQSKRSPSPSRRVRFAATSPTVNAASDNTTLALGTVSDVIYLTNITIGGKSYPVQIDTGSSDLWVKGDTTPLPGGHPTSLTYNLTYGIGWAFGNISYAEVQFADITVPSQAFLDASDASNPALQYADGILGLGFTSLSTVDALINSTNASTGRSLLYNLFLDNPSEPNFIAISLQRSLEPGSDVEGSFAIGEYEPEYASVANSPKIPTWPVSYPKRWNVLVDAVLIGNQTVIPSSTVVGAPSNKAVALLDSGTSYTYVPKEIANAIYGNIDGASFDSQTGQWAVPCGPEIDMAIQIGGQVFPMHPLDITPDFGTGNCVGSFVAGSVAVGQGEFDWLIGDNVLRSLYSVYDFGDFDSNNVMGDPYVQLLALVDPNEASQEFVKIRGGTAKTGITYNAANDTSGGSVSGQVTVSADLSDTLNKIGTYLPVMLGVMALNALVIIILIIVGLVFLCRKRRKSSGRTRTTHGRVTPAPSNPRNSYVAGSLRGQSPESHVYQPVSMAITEDTMFVPPSPGFRKFDGERPKSMATLFSPGPDQNDGGSEDAIFSSSSSRPKSMGNLPKDLPEDQPFTPPPINTKDVDKDADQISLKSIHSNRRSPVDRRPSMDGVTLIDTAAPLEHFPLLPGPESPVITESPIQVAEGSNPSPAPRPPVPNAQVRPRSILKSAPTLPTENLLSSSTSPQHLQPMAAPVAPGSAPASNGLMPQPPFRRPGGVSLVDRPMSAVILPSQSQVRPSAPGARPLRSALRANPSTTPRPMSANVPTMTIDVPEEDITSTPPSAPFLRRSPLSKSYTDRPSSMAV